jgi:hypothetical protein
MIKFDKIQGESECRYLSYLVDSSVRVQTLFTTSL